MHHDNTPPRGPDERLSDITDRINAGERLRRHPDFQQAAVTLLAEGNKRLDWWLSDQIDIEFRSIVGVL